MTYGRFFRVSRCRELTGADLYDAGRTAIVEATDPELDKLSANAWCVDFTL
jgi:cell division protease FtsH